MKVKLFKILTENIEIDTDDFYRNITKQVGILDVSDWEEMSEEEITKLKSFLVSHKKGKSFLLLQEDSLTVKRRLKDFIAEEQEYWERQKLENAHAEAKRRKLVEERKAKKLEKDKLKLLKLLKDNPKLAEEIQ